ncbi:monothiol glutaredoxin-S2-like [Coffea arabica]|uniref:Monothiol glutaredoxin-S2-like n=1 Tax=Coffea arabica TaxID=13443 RepID=A0A6P6VFR8_COFAR|nr:monothiol glutaredoxin-S2-like [Coffea arabica]
MGMVTKLGSENPVVIFSKSNCGMCHTIKTLINNFGANPKVYEIDQHQDGQKMERELLHLGQEPSVPTVFIGKEMIGGSDEVIGLNVKGELKPLLIRAKAIWI